MSEDLNMAVTFSKSVENSVGKGQIASSQRTISPFPTASSKELYLRHIKPRACLGKVNPDFHKQEAEAFALLPTMFSTYQKQDSSL